MFSRERKELNKGGNKVNKQQNILQEANLCRNYILKVRSEFLVTKGQVKVSSYF